MKTLDQVKSEALWFRFPSRSCTYRSKKGSAYRSFYKFVAKNLYYYPAHLTSHPWQFGGKIYKGHYRYGAPHIKTRYANSNGHYGASGMAYYMTRSEAYRDWERQFEKHRARWWDEYHVKYEEWDAAWKAERAEEGRRRVEEWERERAAIAEEMRLANIYPRPMRRKRENILDLERTISVIKEALCES